jgi:hypothetical protein
MFWFDCEVHAVGPCKERKFLHSFSLLLRYGSWGKESTHDLSIRGCAVHALDSVATVITGLHTQNKNNPMALSP